MEFTKEQVEGFIKIHKGYPEFKKYTEAEIREIANGVANYYATLFRIYRRLKKEGVEF
jgi:hypothetical protein